MKSYFNSSLVIAAALGCGLLVGACSSASSGATGNTSPAQAQEQRRRSANFITAEDIDRYPSASSVEELLLQLGTGIVRGRGGGIQIMGRGGSPLYVINGVPLSSDGGGVGLNPRDIASIEIIRDGAQTAEYGFRGSNGIILIRTKQ